MFKDRKEAGTLLAKRIKENFSFKDCIVLGITRGGVAVAQAIAAELNLPLSCIVIKKIGAPNSPEFSIGAVGPEETVFWDKDFERRVRASAKYKKETLQLKIQEQKQTEKLFKSVAKSFDFQGKTVLLVDDGVATGATVLCAQKYLAEKKAKTILVSPVIANDTYKRIKKYFDEIVGLEITSDFFSISSFYKNFSQIENDDVINLLAKYSVKQ